MLAPNVYIFLPLCVFQHAENTSEKTKRKLSKDIKSWKTKKEKDSRSNICIMALSLTFVAKSVRVLLTYKPSHICLDTLINTIL